MFVKIRLLLGQWLTTISKKLGSRLYFLLATLLTIAIALDAYTTQIGLHIENSLFDYLFKQRTIKPQANQNIVLIDIDQASISKLNERLGTPPWSKQVFGELVEYLETKQPDAIVFDITFDQTDTTHPDGDLYFSEVVRAYPNIIFPIERLDPSKDFSSSLRYTQIPSATALPHANQTATLAAKTPYLTTSLTSTQLGMHKISRDFDGNTRTYQTIYENQGWQIASLAKAVAKTDTDSSKTIYLNWRHSPYQRLPFHQVYASITDETISYALKGKIIIIGSSIDASRIQQTILAKRISNMEVLATAIDNIQHGDYLTVWKDKYVYLALSLVLVWFTALLFHYQLANIWFFTLATTALFIANYVALNIGNIYFATAAAILWAIAYFIPAKCYEMLTTSRLQRWLSFGSTNNDAPASVLVMPILVEGLAKPLSDRQIRKIKRHIQLNSKTPCTVDSVKSVQSGIWQLLSDMLIVSWTVSNKNTAYLESAKTDAENVIKSLPTLTNEANLAESATFRHTLYESSIHNTNETQTLATQWRIILAEAILSLEQGKAVTQQAIEVQLLPEQDEVKTEVS